jgi:hypothetical protein
MKIELAENRKKVTVDVENWKPLLIEYGLLKISKQVYLLWNVNGTNHTFNIPLSIVLKHHSGNYIEHFKLTLNQLRDDLIIWKNEIQKEDWMLYYLEEFSKFTAI